MSIQWGRSCGVDNIVFWTNTFVLEISYSNKAIEFDFVRGLAYNKGKNV